MSSNIKDKKTSKKRTLKETQSDDESSSDDQDLAPPEPKRRKLDTNKNTNESKDPETDDIKENTKSKSTSLETAPQFKICCYNLNGVRAAHKHGLEEYIQKEDADIVCFSEMKAKLSQNPCAFRGYEIIWNECTDKAGYSGTAILSKTKPLSIVRGIGYMDGEGRAITVEYDKFYLINTYVPNSGQKLKFKEKRVDWDKYMKKWLKKMQNNKPIIWTGDLNVAFLDFDVYDGETNKNRKKSPGFTPYERENFKNIKNECGLIDTFRHFYPKEREKHFTFFSNRSRGTDMKKENRGWRLDYFMVSKNIINIIDDVQIRKK
eukprot:88273_1